MALINKSKIKEYTELNLSEEIMSEIEKKAEEMIKKAEERAKANGRRTIFSRDL
jgi:histone H3/H4|tara:strand:- start:327 stop:488 length:162 start_codon:yes stop_codon:yes gene_type:complete